VKGNLMSAPHTNIDKQQRRHRGPLIGMALVVTLVAIGFIWWLGIEAGDPDLAPGAQSPLNTSDTAPAAPAY
jgi:hypothetical protein